MHIYGHMFTCIHTFLFLNARFIHMGPPNHIEVKVSRREERGVEGQGREEEQLDKYPGSHYNFSMSW